MSTLRKSALVHRPEDATHWNNASEMITLMTRLGIWYGTDGVGARVDFQLQTQRSIHAHGAPSGHSLTSNMQTSRSSVKTCWRPIGRKHSTVALRLCAEPEPVRLVLHLLRDACILVAPADNAWPAMPRKLVDVGDARTLRQIVCIVAHFMSVRCRAEPSRPSRATPVLEMLLYACTPICIHIHILARRKQQRPCIATNIHMHVAHLKTASIATTHACAKQSWVPRHLTSF